MVIKSYEKEILTIKCPKCWVESPHDLTGWTSDVNEDFGGFENYLAICPTDGCDGAIAVNLDIPILYDMDLYAMECFAPESDRIIREILRNLIWDKRVDLQDIDREQFADAYKVENADEIAAIRNELSSIKGEGDDE